MGKADPQSEREGPWLTPARATLLAAVLAAVVTVTGWYVLSRKEPVTPSPVAVEITPLRSGESVEAVRKSGHNSARFHIPVFVSGDLNATGLSVFIMVNEGGKWEIQRDDNPIVTGKGPLDVTAWSGGGDITNRTKDGQEVKIRAVLAKDALVGEFAPAGSKPISENGAEIFPAAISPVITIRVHPIQEMD